MRTLRLEVLCKVEKWLGFIPVTTTDPRRVRLGDDGLIFDFEAQRIFLGSAPTEPIAEILTHNRKSLSDFRGTIRTTDGVVLTKSRNWVGFYYYEVFGEKVAEEWRVRHRHFDLRSHEPKTSEGRISADLILKTEEYWRTVYILAALWLVQVYENSNNTITT
jgi:hypothetical protein